MVKIRLTRTGAKKAPTYRIVVADSRYPRDGRFIDQIGYHKPADKAKDWMFKGAQPTETVKSLFKKNGIID